MKPSGTKPPALIFSTASLASGLACGSDGKTNMRALAGRAGNLPEFRRGDRIGHDQLELEVLLRRLAQDQAGLGVVAAEIDDVRLHVLQLGDERRIILLAGIDAFIDRPP